MPAYRASLAFEKSKKSPVEIVGQPGAISKATTGRSNARNGFRKAPDPAGCPMTTSMRSVAKIWIRSRVNRQSSCPICRSQAIFTDAFGARTATGTVISKPQLWLRMTPGCPLPVTVFMTRMGSDGKATRDDLHRKDWDDSSCGLVRLRLLPTCPSVPQGGYYWAAKGDHF